LISRRTCLNTYSVFIELHAEGIINVNVRVIEPIAFAAFFLIGIDDLGDFGNVSFNVGEYGDAGDGEGEDYEDYHAEDVGAFSGSDGALFA
jgi:hypothetical protein